jgi:hypothetical protein
VGGWWEYPGVFMAGRSASVCLWVSCGGVSLGWEGSVGGVSLGAENMEGVQIYVQLGGLWNRMALVVLLRGSHVTLFSHLVELTPVSIAPNIQDN